MTIFYYTNKYIAYLGSGGLTHMFGGIAFSIRKAIKLNRQLIIKTENNPLFNRKFSKYFYINLPIKIIENNNEVQNLSEEENNYLNSGPIYKAINTYFVKNINISSVDDNSQDKIIYFTKSCGIIDEMKYIKCHQNIIDELSKLDSYDNILGVHYRNTDIKTDYEDIFYRIKFIINKCDVRFIYLATDNYEAIEKFKKNISVEIVNFTTPPILPEGKGIHRSSFDKDTLILNTLTDMYNLINCEYFIPSKKSSLSRWILELRRKNTLF
jgi:hypothetical protein